MQDKSKKKPILIPFRLIRYIPNIETQVLMTTRKEKFVKTQASKRRSQSIEPQAAETELAADNTEKLTTEQLLSTFRSSLRDTDTALLPAFEENILRLKSISQNTHNNAVALPKLKKFNLVNRQFRSQTSLITAMSIPAFTSDNLEVNDREFRLFKKGYDLFYGF